TLLEDVTKRQLFFKSLKIQWIFNNDEKCVYFKMTILIIQSSSIGAIYAI
ncbi:3457_t:CDS:1, partial [Racocetra persica]